MSFAHVHLMLNHLPLAGTLVGLILLATALLRRRTSRDLANAGLVALVASAVLAIPTYLTGEAAEEIVENLPGVAESLIEQHEEAAVAALFAIELTGVVALGALVLERVRPRKGNALVATVLALCVISVAITAWVANLGGQIHHSELRSSTTGGESGGGEVSGAGE